MAVGRRLRFEIFRRDGHACRYCGAKAPDVALTVDHVIPQTLGGSDDPSNLVAACADCNSGKSSVPAGSPLVDDVAADALRWQRAIDQAREERLAEREVVDSMLSDFEELWDRWGYTVEVQDPPIPQSPTGEPLVDHWHEILGIYASHAEPLGIEAGIIFVRAERGYTADIRFKIESTLDRWASVLGEPVVGFKVDHGKVNPPPGPIRQPKREVRKTVPLDVGWRESVERFFSLGLTMDDLERLIRVSMTARNVKTDDIFRYFCGCAWNTISDLQESARRILESES